MMNIKNDEIEEHDANNKIEEMIVENENIMKSYDDNAEREIMMRMLTMTKLLNNMTSMKMMKTKKMLKTKKS